MRMGDFYKKPLKNVSKKLRTRYLGAYSAYAGGGTNVHGSGYTGAGYTHMCQWACGLGSSAARYKYGGH
jgi:hypothetical protein